MLQLKCFLKNPGFSIRGIEQISALGCGGRGNKISQIEGYSVILILLEVFLI